jgi:gluconolactonase
MECQYRVQRVHSALDEIIPSDVAVEKVADGFGFTEGPVWIKQGFLLFSDIPNNVIYKWDSTQGVSEFLKPSGYDGHSAPAGSHIGSNGLTLDRQGKLIICEHGNRRLTRLENDGCRTVLADKYDGKRLNSPNDVVCKSDGALYFTDPPYGLLKRDADPAKELPFNGVYRLTDARLQLLYDGLSRPNGLAFSPDEKHVFVANSDPRRKIWIRFDVARDGTLGNGEILYNATHVPTEGVPDGLKVDRLGNLYCTGPGGIWVFSPSGQHLGTIEFPEVPANCNWGDADGKTLYVTARTSVYRIRLNIEGIRPLVHPFEVPVSRKRRPPST